MQNDHNRTKKTLKNNYKEIQNDHKVGDPQPLQRHQMTTKRCKWDEGDEKQLQWDTKQLQRDANWSNIDTK